MTNFVITENSLTYLIPQRWESDEALGDMAEYAPVLYSNKKHPDLKEKIPRKLCFYLHVSEVTLSRSYIHVDVFFAKREMNRKPQST